jgi:hypothetical protein
VTRGEREFEEMERIALYLLTDPENQPTIWSIPDIGRAMAYYDPRDALVEPLHRAGTRPPDRQGVRVRYRARSTSSRWSAKSSEPLHERHVAGLDVAFNSTLRRA